MWTLNLLVVVTGMAQNRVVPRYRSSWWEEKWGQNVAEASDSFKGWTAIPETVSSTYFCQQIMNDTHIAHVRAWLTLVEKRRSLAWVEPVGGSAAHALHRFMPKMEYVGATGLTEASVPIEPLFGSMRHPRFDQSICKKGVSHTAEPWGLSPFLLDKAYSESS